MNRMIRVLIVDDSALVRQILQQGLDSDPEIEVVGAAPDPFVARDQIVELRPDVMTLDVEMPRMDGVEFLRRLMPQHPLPVVMVSSLTHEGQRVTLDALAAGAVDFVAKPKADVGRSLRGMMGELREKVKAASHANVSGWKQQKASAPARVLTAPPALAESTDKVIVIGASTGGTEAIRAVTRLFPPDMPGTVVVQHMPPGFTQQFAERLNEECAMTVREAETGDRVLTGRMLIAPGGLQTRVNRIGGMYQVMCSPGEKVSGHCPSVDVAMQSTASQAGTNAVGVILTGMGGDGADGLAAMRKAGAHTIAQDEATSVVYGMPKVAVARGGVESVQPLERIAETVIRMLSQEPGCR